MLDFSIVLVFLSLTVNGISPVAGSLSSSSSNSTQVRPTAEVYSPLIAQKVLVTAQNNTGDYPWYTDSEIGKWNWFVPNNWISGFLPATLFKLNTRSKKCRSTQIHGVDYRALGNQWTPEIVPLEIMSSVGVDIGFLSYPLQEQLLLNPHDKAAIHGINTFAAHYADRFNPIVGCTRSLDTTDAVGFIPDFEVIIDNMKTLQLLFASADLTNNQTLRDIAISHADKTMLNHFRPDGSTFHVVEYNHTTGAVIRKRTSFGFADNSTWTRGQSWAIHGFADMYLYTKYPRYLETARRAAAYYLSHLPSNGVPPWDFNAPSSPTPPFDTSSSTAAASGLLLLSRLESSLTPANITGAKFYSDAAIKLLNDAVKVAWKPEWHSILSNGTSNNRLSPPINSTGIIYGDYFFVKAGNDLLDMGLAACN
ncbi:glycoside hydrolase family 88 protein [Ramaria rubella]|nr:glycoside hydrolase family 88 protein [Ramaria rubella]